MIEEIRKKCIEANEDIVALKFGCEVNTNFLYKGSPAPFNPEGKNMRMEIKNRRIVFIKQQNATTKIGMDFYVLFDDGDHIEQYSERGELEDIKIIGRPIRLSDILATLPKYASRGILRDSVNKVEIHEDASEIIWFWNLKKDNLEHQSKETIKFLHNLLI